MTETQVRPDHGDFATDTRVVEWARPGQGDFDKLVENLRKLPTSMRNLHSWYSNATKRGIESIMVRVKEEHYFQEYSVSVDFCELFQLYNLRALDKSIISSYCL